LKTPIKGVGRKISREEEGGYGKKTENSTIEPFQGGGGGKKKKKKKTQKKNLFTPLFFLPFKKKI